MWLIVSSYPVAVLDTIGFPLAVLLLLAAAALAAIAVLALTGRLQRNRWAGVRSPATMASSQAFALGNRVAALPMLAGAALLVLAALAVATFSGAVVLVAVLLCVAGAIALVVAGGALGNRAAASACAPDRCADCTGCELMDSLR